VISSHTLTCLTLNLTVMGEIEIWVYRGLIVFLAGVVIKFITDKYTDQKKQNTDLQEEHDDFNAALIKLTASVEKLNTTLETQHTISKLQHDTLDARLSSHKDKMLSYDKRMMKLEEIVTENSIQIRVLIEKMNN